MEIYRGKRVYDQKWLFTLTKTLLLKSDTLNGFSGLGLVQVNPELSPYWRIRIVRHEWTHVNRMETYFKLRPNLFWKVAGHIVWRFKYLTDKAFAKEEERIADAAEIASPIKL